jgi:heptosyltransferase-2
MKIKRPQHILVIAPAWIGDMVMAQTLFKLLKSNSPDIIIDVLAPRWTLPLVERMPEINKGILFPLDHGQLKLAKRYALAKQLRRSAYDQAIVLPGSFKSALTALWAKIPLRTGWVGEWRYGLLNDIRSTKKQLPLLIQQYLALGLSKASPLPQDLASYYPSLQILKENQQRLLKQLNLTHEKPILALCPGAEYGASKRWPTHHFAQVATEKLAYGWEVWIFGSPKDAGYAQEIQLLTNHKCIDLTGKTSLLEAIDLLACADAVISNDSGLMHIAAALNIPLVVMYGSTTPNFTPPLTSKSRTLSLNLECSPCFERVCPLGHTNCMQQMRPEQVLSKLDELLK